MCMCVYILEEEEKNALDILDTTVSCGKTEQRSGTLSL